MKAVFEVNYSRKMSALKHRLVIVPPGSELDDRDCGRERVLYWQWAFESPQNIKTIVRRELGPDNTPSVRNLPDSQQPLVRPVWEKWVSRQMGTSSGIDIVAMSAECESLRCPGTVQGHIRLILLPIVYNAMASKSELRDTPLFQALEAAMRQSTYCDLLQHAQPKPEEESPVAGRRSFSSDGRYHDSSAPPSHICGVA